MRTWHSSHPRSIPCLSVLEQMRESERPPRASRDALRQLWSEQPNKEELLAPLRERVRACMRCPHLASSRTQTVFGVGNPDADLMFVGEAPGADEDAQGEPFVGRAGQLLTRIIETMGFTRADVYIANVLKCRPDMPKGSFGNRAPTLNGNADMPSLSRRTDRNHSPESTRRAWRRRGGRPARNPRQHARTARPMARIINETPLMITYHPAYLAAKPGAVGKTQGLGGHAACSRTAGAPDQRKAAQLFLMIL